MPWRDRFVPARMCRAAIVAPRSRCRAVLVHIADLGVFQPDEPDVEPSREAGPASMLVGQLRPSADAACLSLEPIEPEQLADAHRFDLLVGEASLEQRLAAVTSTDRCAVLLGWTPDRHIGQLRSRVEPLGASLVELPVSAGATPPSMLAPFAGKAGRVLVDTYSTVPYKDVDPTVFATIAYVVMFGMMFGDVGHGAIVAALGLVARRIDRPSLRALQRVWVIVFGAGLASMAFGFLYGEAFGPTGLVPVVWLEPLAEPDRLLTAGVVLGAVLLAVTYVLATIDRWREGGLATALYASSGLAGALIFAGVASIAGGVAGGGRLVWQAGLGLVCLGLLLTVIGLLAELGRTASALLQVAIEVFDVMLRLGSNLVSFARLAAFGLTHAAISKVVWDATASSWGSPAGSVAAVVIFVVGNALAFVLEALVAGIQALRLEYYELFSRLFISEGQPFHPWHIPTRPALEDT